MTRSLTVATNRKARHDYHILETLEAGIALHGSEVKSLRLGRGSLRDSYARVDRDELFLYNMHISPYDQGSHFKPDPKRTRKLLMHKREIRRLAGKTTERGLTLVPLRLYFARGKAKVELALGRGKRAYDRRDDIQRREADRAVQRALKDRTLARQQGGR
jgi:SsrA-binding protein